MRVVVALAEFVLAAAAVLAGVWLWHRGVVRIEFPTDSGTVLVSSRLLGSYAGGAVALVTVAGLLVLDALRQLMLGTRPRRRRREGRELELWQRIEAEERAIESGRQA